MNGYYKVNLIDLMCLYDNLEECLDNDTDAHKTAQDYRHLLKKAFFGLTKSNLESLLCFCNYNLEDEMFTHPEGDSFDEMVKRILPKNEIFNKEINCIVSRKK